MDRLKLIWPILIVVLVAFTMVISIILGLVDPKSLMF